jgi:SAM-dependent methyltransferase
MGDRRPDQQPERVSPRSDVPLTELGLSFGSVAEAYDRARPEWPEEILEEVPLHADATVVDLGAGTGRLTRLLAAHFRRVVAVEPDAAMRARITVGEPVAGWAEAIPLGDTSVDGVFVAEAFHWFDWEHALAEILRVLVPGGTLALLWSRYAEEDHLLPDGVLPHSSSPKHGAFMSGEWRQAFVGTPFEPFRALELRQERDVSREQLVEHFSSVSLVAALPPAERHETLGRIAAALPRPRYRQRWTVCLYWTRLPS